VSLFLLGVEVPAMLVVVWLFLLFQRAWKGTPPVSAKVRPRPGEHRCRSEMPGDSAGAAVQFAGRGDELGKTRARRFIPLLSELVPAKMDIEIEI